MPTYVIRGRKTGRARGIDLEQLNDQQRAVVCAGEGPMLVIAGAGSGKTRTLTYRAGWLIERGLDPERLLLCTFTNRAAREMSSRVAELLGVDLRRMWSGTFHHIANLALRRHGSVLGLDERYTILDREDSRELMTSCLAEEGPALRRRRYPKAAVLLDVCSWALSNQLEVAAAVRERASRFVEMTEAIERIIKRFAERKLKLALVDFDDLLLLFRLLLEEHPTAAQALLDRFEHVLVDEYQDTNKLQGRIVDLCAARSGNLMVVGDDAQSIYSFRGAYFKNIIDFPKRYPAARVFKLEHNYRSVPEVLELANASIKVNIRQHPKMLRATRPRGMRPALVAVHDVYVQAAFVAQRALELSQQEGIPLSQIAVLYRAHSHSLELQLELTERRVPFSVRSGPRFFEQAHIKDVVAYLRVSHNSGDTLAWRRLLSLWPGVGAKTTAQVIEAIERASPETSVVELLASDALFESVPRSARASLSQLAELCAALADGATPGELIGRVLDAHYRDHAHAAYANAEARLEDLDTLAGYAARYETLERFLSELALVASVAAEGISPQDDPEDERLTLSTVHQSKGLEWRVVFVLWLSEGHFPQGRSARTHAEVEEERRLFYVAATRAKDQLYLCRPRFEESGAGPRRILRLSRFLDELRGERQLPYEVWDVEEEEEPAAGAAASQPELPL
ncbi:MAG: ATP-dependent helicase [Myxococcales bacterium]|nr:ATP-dependent helicase [Myxococcales bacterium]